MVVFEKTASPLSELGNIAIYEHEHYEQDDQGVVFLAPTLKAFIDYLTELPEGL